jgi:tryptophan-specific transport protein
LKDNKPLWQGILLVAGGAIGAGIFALPIVSAGAWMMWSAVGFVTVWAMTYIAASLFAKINLAIVSDTNNQLDFQSSFSSLVSHVLGTKWALLNNLSIVFIMMILMYAYTSAGASIVSYSFESIEIDVGLDNRPWLSLGFAALIGLIIWIGTSFVSRIILALMVGMALTFGVATIGVLPSVKLSQLIAPIDTAHYVLGALPVYLTAFACGGLIPSLVRHYQNQQQRVFQSLFWGTLLALVAYLFWLTVTLGSIGREGFVTVIQNGGNLADLVNALVNTGADSTLQARLSLFSHFAIITSYLSVGIGLLQFMQDRLALSNSFSHRFAALMCCFVPPTLASFFFPYGFVYAISYAGIFVALSFFIVPGLMAAAMSNRKKLVNIQYSPYVVSIFGILIIALKVALIFSLLPSFGLENDN